jgi:septal ring factor EnvC (AmiA/AmiB activator)
MKRLLAGLTLCTCLCAALFAQTNSAIKELEERHTALQKQIRESETLVRSAKNDVTGQLNSLNTLSGQITERIRYVQQINDDLETIGRQQKAMERDLQRLGEELDDRKKKYEASVQYLYKHRLVEEKLLFIFSAQTLAQTYRRLRYINEYATYLRLQGEEILEKQHAVEKKREELQAAQKAKESLLKEREEERKRLEKEEQVKKTLLAALQKKQKTLQHELDKRRREANTLNARIDKLIAEEIEKSRKPAGDATKPSARELSGSLADNRGKLPVPVTGTYIIVNRYGQYNVQGLRNVKLDNKGIDIQGRPGAQARAIFDGEVTAVFEISGLSNVLVRHGDYISVYCNLTAVSVKKGAKVKARQSLGTIFSDKTDNNRTILHFQLRKEREQLNPEPWLDR